MDPELLAQLTSAEDIGPIVAAIAEADLETRREEAADLARTLHEAIATSADPTGDADRIAALVTFANACDARQNAAAASRQRAGELVASLSVTTPPASVTPAAEAVVASAPVLIRAADEDPPAVPGQARHALVAAAGLDQTQAGSVFTDRLAFAREMTSALDRLGPPGPNQAAKHVVGAIRNYGRDTILGDDGNSNEVALLDVQRRVQRGEIARQAITAASGPFCAPAEPIYEMFNLPVGGLVTWPTVDAPRGRRTYPVSPSLTDITGDWLAMLGSQTSPKPCFLVECGENTLGSVVSYPLCLTFDNFTGRFYPELVDDRIAKSVARFGFVIQAALLNQIETTMANQVAAVNAGGGFLIALARALRASGARYRSQEFLPPDFNLDVLLPAWIPDAIAIDIISRDATLDFATTVQGITAVLEGGGFNIQWVNGWQAIPDAGWDSTTVRALMYAPGTIVRLSGGELNLGVQRDSTLNSLNRYQIFQETWDGVVKVGYKVLLIEDIVVCANGATGEREAITCGTVTNGS